MNNYPFDHAFERYGGKLDLESVSINQENVEKLGNPKYFLEVIRHLADSPVASSKDGLPIGSIGVCFINNLGFNAIATIFQGFEMIGLHYGAIADITKCWHTVFADPLTFSDIGDSDKEVSAGFDIAEIILPATRSDKITKMPIFAVDSYRAQMASRLTTITCYLLFYHELAHIGHCHLPVMRDMFGFTEYPEFSAVSISEKESIVRRAFELDADAGALYYTHTIWKKLTGENGFEEFKNVDLEFMWGSVIAMLFCIMEVNSPTKHSSPLNRTHPNTITRLEGALAISCLENGPRGLQMDEKRVLNGIKEIVRWFEKHKLISIDEVGEELNEIDVLRKELNSHTQQIRSYQMDRAMLIKGRL